MAMTRKILYKAKANKPRPPVYFRPDHYSGGIGIHQTEQVLTGDSTFYLKTLFKGKHLSTG